MSKTHTERTITGVKYNFLNTVSKTLLQFVVGVVLARLIPPQEFGLMGMAYVFIGLANLFSTLGMGAAVIQRKDLTENHIRAATTLSFLLGSILLLFFYFASPAISAFYNEPRLTNIIRVISILFIFQGVYSITRGISARRIDFKTIFNVELYAFLIGQGVVSVTFAVLNFGVWSLVYGRIATGILSFVLLFAKEKHSFKPYFKKQETKELLGFGSGVSLIGIFNYAASNVDYLIIGKFLNAFSVGLYTRAYTLMTIPIAQISQTMSGVLFSAYSEIQDDIKRLANAYLKSIGIIAFLGFPIIAAMVVNAAYIIEGLYGKNWIGAIEVFKILSVAAFLKIVTHTQGAVTKATGKVFNEVWRQFIYLIFITLGILIGVKFGGLEGVGYGIIVASAWLYFSMSLLVTKILNLKMTDFFKAQIPGLVISLILFVVDHIFVFLIENFASQIHVTIKLGIMVIVSTAVILLSIILLPRSIKGDLPEWVSRKFNVPFIKRFL